MAVKIPGTLSTDTQAIQSTQVVSQHLPVSCVYNLLQLGQIQVLIPATPLSSCVTLG